MPNEKQKQGIKRKRETTSSEENLTTKLTGKLHHGLREVRKAAKKAKIFETQRLVKRLKGLRAKDPNAEAIVGLESELEVLKHIDHDPVAKRALKSKLKKDRVLSSNTHAQAAITVELSADLLAPSPAGTPVARVESRLLSSKTLAAEVHAVVESLREVINPTKKLKQDEFQGEEDGDEEGNAGEEDMERLGKASERATAAAMLVEAEDESDHEQPDNIGWESGSVHGESEEDEEADDVGWESGSINEGPAARPPQNASSEVESSDSDDEVDEESSDSETRPPPQKVPRQSAAGKDTKGKSKATGAESTFLPSLSVGFTRGDSDASDFSDTEAKAADDVRKNRRGQRARRAIWEKKYGRNANHVKKEHEVAAQNPRQKGAGWNQKGGPRNSTPSSKRGPPPPQARPNAPRPDHAAGNRPQPRSNIKEQEKPLHPSWEAKKRLKEKFNPSMVAPQGKKITFA
ncbi:Bud-site selection protein [Obba rivulosa]|uniref:Bud-site selection protein n=1 Tax=Obba rivulosa TaxID=1052685 RepID=A0A8E2DKT7_9APHY|nr:Bud-site selection protein [Obba rivulosa]